nr:MAG TPA: hypothetical protein [Caudoviricetes sp.]
MKFYLLVTCVTSMSSSYISLFLFVYFLFVKYTP